MPYDQTRRDLKAFQRWAVTGLYKAVPFENYDPHIKAHRAEEKAMSRPLPLFRDEK